MAKFDKVLSPLRVEAAAALDGVAGIFGNGDLLVVGLDGSGRLILPGTVANAFGVILTTEKTRDNHYVSAADQKKVVGGQRYTVMRTGEILDAATFDTPIAAGTQRFALATGGVGATAVTAVYIGVVLPREEDSTQLRFCVDVSQSNAAA